MLKVMYLRRLAFILACIVAVPISAQQANTESIRQLARDGKFAAALVQIDQELQKNPGDRQIRFLKGVVLAENKQTTEAIEVFRKLTVDFPQLPEPYNNLAVLYAGQGDYDLARDALLQAINTHPSYATAHENLGDIYAKMAGVAYDKALSIDTSNATAKHKLALIDELFGSAVTVTRPKTAAVEVTPEPATSVPLVESAPVVKAMPVVAALSAADTAAIAAAVNAWARDWAAQDVNAYLSHYAPHFKPAGGLSYKRWQKQRRDRLLRPKFIRVEISTPVIQPRSKDIARAQFVQRYESNTYKGTARKRLSLERTPEGWRIIREQVRG